MQPADDMQHLIDASIPDTRRIEIVEDHQDALYAALSRLMDSDERSNMLFGYVNRGEAEDLAAMLVFAKYSGSPVMLDHSNMVLMARRAEAGAFLKQMLDTIKAIGRREDATPGLLQRIRGRF